jgi:hypothetical protein
VLGDLRNGHRQYLLRDQPGEPFTDRHSQRANALAPQTDRGGENKVSAIRFQQVSGTDVGFKASRNKRDDIHERFSGLAALLY